MTVPTNPAPSLPLEVERFIADHGVSQWPVPEAQCPECYRTLVADSLLLSHDSLIWDMKCPTHRTHFGVTVS